MIIVIVAASTPKPATTITITTTSNITRKTVPQQHPYAVAAAG
jgi:hypothetical protein